jgi:phage terminase small subunit
MRTPNSPDLTARMTPPRHLAKGPAIIWKQIVASVASGHFQECDRVLLTEFCRAADLANESAAALQAQGAIVDGRANPWVAVQEKSQRALVALALRLRLAPQSRFDRLKAGTNARTGVPSYGDDEDDNGLLARP